MGGNTIPLQFDFKPHRSISWMPFSGSSFYRSFFSILQLSLLHSLTLSSWVSIILPLSFFSSLTVFITAFRSVGVIFILFRAACLWRFVLKSKFAAVTSSDCECHYDISVSRAIRAGCSTLITNTCIFTWDQKWVTIHNLQCIVIIILFYFMSSLVLTAANLKSNILSAENQYI